MRVFLALSQGLQEYSKLILLLEKHGNALGLMTFWGRIRVFADDDFRNPRDYPTSGFVRFGPDSWACISAYNIPCHLSQLCK